MCIVGPVTGGHANPAVSLAVLIAEPTKVGQNISWFVFMVLGQFIGGIFACFMFMFCKDTGRRLIPEEDFPVLYPNTYTIFGTFFTEILCTFFFIYVIMLHKDARVCYTLTPDGLLMKATVAMTLCAMIFVGGSHSGGCYNPAVGLSIGFLCHNQNTDLLYTKCHRYTWLYMLAPFAGGALAGMISMVQGRIAMWITDSKELDRHADDKDIHDRELPLLNNTEDHH